MQIRLFACLHNLLPETQCPISKAVRFLCAGDTVHCIWSKMKLEPTAIYFLSLLELVNFFSWHPVLITPVNVITHVDCRAYTFIHFISWSCWLWSFSVHNWNKLLCDSSDAECKRFLVVFGKTPQQYTKWCGIARVVMSWFNAHECVLDIRVWNSNCWWELCKWTQREDIIIFLKKQCYFSCFSN